jgi:hypothetical protein
MDSESKSGVKEKHGELKEKNYWIRGKNQRHSKERQFHL